MHKLDIKPLSVNEAKSIFRGRITKTKAYRQYERDLLILLPRNLDFSQDRFKVFLIWGFSSKLSDADNPVKPFIDILQTAYGFNDNQIYEYSIKKEIVKKGQEFIKFKVEPFT